MGNTENLTTDTSKEKKEGIISKIVSNFGKKEELFNAEVAWHCSTHGEGSYLPIGERIKEKQYDIKCTIQSKYAPSRNSTLLNHSSYHCVIDIEEDLMAHTEEILQPFKDGGFEIIDLSKECKSLADNGIYLIGWKNVYRQHKA